VLKQLRWEHALNTVIKLYNAPAFHAYSGQQATPDDRTFHLLGALYGSEPWVRHVSPFVTNALQQAHCFDDVAMLDQDGLTRAPQLVQALARIFAGTPTRFAVQQAFALQHAEECQHVDRVSHKGLIFIIPVVPLTSEAIRRTLDILNQCSTRYKVSINTTINILSDSAVEMVSSIIFHRAPENIRHVHLLKRSIVEELQSHSIPLMRLDIDSHSDTHIFPQMNYKDVLVKLKKLFDPNALIAPGQYIPQE